MAQGGLLACSSSFNIRSYMVIYDLDMPKMQQTIYAGTNSGTVSAMRVDLSRR